MLGSIIAGIDAISGLANLFTGSKPASGASTDSDFAAVLAQAQQSADSTTAKPDDLLTAYQQNLHDFRDRVEELLNKLGIDTNGQPLQVQLSLLQELVVSGEHPQLAEAQAALQQDPQLTSLFAILQQQAAQLAARQNPDAAADEEPPFALQIDGAQITQVKFATQ